LGSRVADAKIVEYWAHFDMTGLMRQIRAMPNN
jgi:predicted ester cyclase